MSSICRNHSTIRLAQSTAKDVCADRSETKQQADRVAESQLVCRPAFTDVFSKKLSTNHTCGLERGNASKQTELISSSFVMKNKPFFSCFIFCEPFFTYEVAVQFIFVPSASIIKNTHQAPRASMPSNVYRKHGSAQSALHKAANHVIRADQSATTPPCN